MKFHNFPILFILTIFFFLLIPDLCEAQEVTLTNKEKKTEALWSEIKVSVDDQNKLRIGSRIDSLIVEMLSCRESFSYSFTSLKYLGKIYSTDSLLRIYSWNIPFLDGTNRYFGYVQKIESPDSENIQLIRLEDKEDLYLNQDSIYTPTAWYGALYYSVIAKKCKNLTYYTVLGFDLNNFFTSKKLIDILTFTEEGLKFGAPIFLDDEKSTSRRIYEFSSQVSMRLRYDQKYERIVLDHLSPSKPEYEGQF
ncbi:MAG: hypothetical protein U9N53_06655, partial [Bacteroidota bacterium]|nr:hypothetical protein [Bacteroidota bacterium]